MKWLCACLAVLAVFFIAAPAMAGEDPYIAIVGNDFFDANRWYLSEKYQNFLYNQAYMLYNPAYSTNADATCFTPQGATTPTCERFAARTSINQPEICDPYGYVSWFCDKPLSKKPFCTSGNLNALTPAGNSGKYEWRIFLPKKPSGQINIVIQCGILKPNAFAAFGFQSIRLCAAETGERIGGGVCVRQEVGSGESPLVNTALPQITATAFPGPGSTFTPFKLTAWKNPSAYSLAIDTVTGAMSNNTNSQILDGSAATRIVLKACMDKTIVTKLPVFGQINAAGETESDLVAGDYIVVVMDVPRDNTVDIYCHSQSARLMGVGESPF